MEKRVKWVDREAIAQGWRVEAVSSCPGCLRPGPRTIVVLAHRGMQRQSGRAICRYLVCPWREPVVESSARRLQRPGRCARRIRARRSMRIRTWLRSKGFRVGLGGWLFMVEVEGQICSRSSVHYVLGLWEFRSSRRANRRAVTLYRKKSDNKAAVLPALGAGASTRSHAPANRQSDAQRGESDLFFARQ